MPCVLTWLDGGVVPTEEMQEGEGWVRRGPGKGQVTSRVQATLSLIDLLPPRDGPLGRAGAWAEAQRADRGYFRVWW